MTSINPKQVLLNLTIDSQVDIPPFIHKMILGELPFTNYNIGLMVQYLPFNSKDYWIKLRDEYNKNCNHNLGSKGLSPKYYVAKFIDNTDVIIESSSKTLINVRDYIDNHYSECESDLEIISIEIFSSDTLMVN